MLKQGWAVAQAYLILRWLHRRYEQNELAKMVYVMRCSTNWPSRVTRIPICVLV